MSTVEIELKACPTSPWVNIESDLPPESTDDAYQEFLASDGERIILATSDGNRVLDDEGDTFVAAYWTPIPEGSWIEGLPQIGARVLADVAGARVITTRDDDG
jgi:hypothetical protein